MPARARQTEAVRPKPEDEGLRYRLAVASRSLAAMAGGYLLANLFVLAFRAQVPMEPRDAGQLALMLSFVVFALAAIWAFATRDAWRAWIGILVPVALCAALWGFAPEAGA